MFLFPALACSTGWTHHLDVEAVGHPEKVIVIGAGIAGLTAAQALHRDGREVIVLEARDRLGGRTFTDEVGGVRVDLGGTWIHGHKGGHNPIVRVLEAHGLSWEADQSMAGVPVVRDAKGTRFGALKLKTAQTFANRILYGDPPNPDLSVAEAVERELDRKGIEGDGREIRGFLTNQGFVELDYAGPAADTSLAGLSAYVSFPGGDGVPKGGYVELVELLARDLDVRLSEPVTRIDWTGPEVAVETSRGSYTATHVVVTLPLGVLKAGSVAFEPPLPDERLAALGRLAMGNLEKVVLSFEDRFWGAAGAWFFYIDDAPGRFPMCVDFTGHTGRPTLVCFTGGAFSRTERASMSEAEIVAGTLENLGRALEREIPDPTDWRVTSWTNDPFSRGSYSYVPMGASAADLDLLGEPVGGRLLFAGEHTISAHFGTVHGALVSGLREARRLGVENVSIPGLERLD